MAALLMYLETYSYTAQPRKGLLDIRSSIYPTKPIYKALSRLDSFQCSSERRDKNYIRKRNKWGDLINYSVIDAENSAARFRGLRISSSGR